MWYADAITYELGTQCSGQGPKGKAWFSLFSLEQVSLKRYVSLQLPTVFPHLLWGMAQWMEIWRGRNLWSPFSAIYATYCGKLAIQYFIRALFQELTEKHILYPSVRGWCFCIEALQQICTCSAVMNSLHHSTDNKPDSTGFFNSEHLLFFWHLPHRLDVLPCEDMAIALECDL